MLVLLLPGGGKLELTGQRAEAAVVLFVAMVQDAGLEDAEFWSAQVHVTPGQIVPRFDRTLKPQKRKMKEAS